jgi:hypothetical protein
MIGYHSFAADHPWLAAAIVWPAIDALIVCFVATRVIQRNSGETPCETAALRNDPTN